MKKITFNELCDLVSNVDYINPKSYPIIFDVDNVEYYVGIGDFVNDTGKDTDINFGGLTEELQFLMSFYNDIASIRDVQDPDIMTYEDIVSMLKKQCNITDNSEIYLYDYESFDGTQEYYIDWEECSEEVKYKALNDPCRFCKNCDCNNCTKIEDYMKIIKEKFA